MRLHRMGHGRSIMETRDTEAVRPACRHYSLVTMLVRITLRMTLGRALSAEVARCHPAHAFWCGSTGRKFAV